MHFVDPVNCLVLQGGPLMPWAHVAVIGVARGAAAEALHEVHRGVVEKPAPASSGNAVWQTNWSSQASKKDN